MSRAYERSGRRAPTPDRHQRGLVALCCAALAAMAACEEDDLAAAAAAAHDPDDERATSAWVRQLRPVALSGVVARWPARTLATPGHRAAVAAPVVGQIEAIFVAPGDVVAAGAPLLRLRSPSRAAEAATLRTALDQLEVVKRRLAVVQRLQRDGFADSSSRYALEREIAALEADAVRARAALAATASTGCEEGEETVRSVRDSALRGDRASARATAPHRPGALSLCAPIGGVVAAVHAQLGGQTGPGDAALVDIAGVGEARVELSRFEAQPAGAQLTFRAGALALPLRPGARSTRVDARDGATLAVHLPLAATAVAAELRGEVEVRLADTGIYAVPRAAVALRDGRPHVFPADDEAGVAVEVVGGDGGETWVRGGGLGRALRVRAVAPGLPGGGED